jgi:hypothetical protein
VECFQWKFVALFFNQIFRYIKGQIQVLLGLKLAQFLGASLKKKQNL